MMNDNDKKLEKLLPWYVSGALEPAERRAVEAWLESHPEAWDDAQGLEALRAHLHSDAVTPGNASLALMKTRARIARRGTGSRRWVLMPAVAALVLAIVGSIVWRVDRPLPDAPVFETLSDDSAMVGEGNVVRVLFNDGLDEAARTSALAAWNARLLGVSAESGVVTVVLNDPNDFAAVRADPRVRFAARSAPAD